MKSASTSFLLISYLVSILETVGLVVVPFFGLYLLVVVDGIVAGVAVVLALLALGAAIAALSALENSLAQDVKDERAVRAR